MQSTLCLVFVLLCLFAGLIEYFRPPGPVREPIFWPLLGLLILELCRLGIPR